MMNIKHVEEAIERIQNGSMARDLESEKLEFKLFPVKDSEPVRKKLSDMLMEYAVAFANSKGGALVMGVEDSVPGPDALTGCFGYDISEMKRMIYNTTRPPIMVDFAELTTDRGSLLVMFVPESPALHSTSRGVKYKRVGKENRIIYPEDELSVKIERGYDYTAGVLSDLDEKAVDPVEVSRLRNWLARYNPVSDALSLDDVRLLEAMGLLVRKHGKLQPTIASVLLVGKEDVIREKLPQSETIFLRFDEDDTTPTAALYMKSPLLKTIDKIWDMIEPYNRIVTIKDAFFETPIPSFPEEVIREGLLNALTHRDYSRNDSVYVKLYRDKIEISSPGGFPGGITPDNVLTHPPVRRNPLLSEAFQHIGVVNRAGLGVDRMYQKLLSYGKIPPEYPYFSDAVVLVIRNGKFDENLARFVGKKAKEGYGWKLNELIVLHYLRRNDRITAADTERMCQISRMEASELLTSMEGQFLERFGTGRGTYYQFSKEVFQMLGESTRYTRISGLSRERMLQLIEQHINKFGRITNREVREICGVNRNMSFNLLKELKDKKKIRLIGSKRGAYYEKNR